MDFAIQVDHRVKTKKKTKATLVKLTEWFVEHKRDIFYPIYQPLRSTRIWHKVNF